MSDRLHAAYFHLLRKILKGSADVQHESDVRTTREVEMTHTSTVFAFVWKIVFGALRVANALAPAADARG